MAEITREPDRAAAAERSPLPYRRASLAARPEGPTVAPAGAPAAEARPSRAAAGPRGRAAAAPQQEDGAEVATATAAGLLIAFVVTLLIPLHFEVLGLRLSPLRIFLLAVFVPLLLRLLQGRAGRMRAIDLLLGLHCVWVFLALSVNHGAARIPFAGITAVEIFGGYLVGRTLILNAVDYRALIRYLLIGLGVVLPFAALEFATDRQPLREISAALAQSFEKAESSRPRMGFYRTMAVFEHPILFGVFCAILLGPVMYLWREQVARALMLAGGVAVMALMSLSSAPLIAVALQFGLVAWDRITRGRWILFLALAAAAYVAVDLVSSRSPLRVMLHYLTFESHTGWARIHIWDAGVAAVKLQPVFGYGLNDFPRPPWLTYSIDNFWLLLAVRYGLPGAGFLVAGVALGAWSVVRARGLSGTARNIRTGHVISLAGLFFVLSTVHVWGATSTLVMCMIGASMWLTSPAAQGAAAPEPGAATPRAAGPGFRRGGRPAAPAPARPAAGVFARAAVAGRRRG